MCGVFSKSGCNFLTGNSVKKSCFWVLIVEYNMSLKEILHRHQQFSAILPVEWQFAAAHIFNLSVG